MSYPIGLPNFGNTCWLNSLLQGLFCSYHFLDTITTIPNNSPFITNLLNVCRETLTKNIPSSRAYLLQFIRTIGWSNGMPEDSSEALLWLIDKLHNDCKKTENAGEELLSSPVYSSLHKFNNGETSLIYNLVQGCYGWKTSDNEQRYEPFITFYLDWADIENGTQNISNCLQKTFENKQIVMMPPLLAICFDRSPEHINFNLTSQFMLYTPDNKKVVYTLKSVILHIGGMAGGHYICIGYRDGGWWIFDDDRVTSIKMNTTTLNDVPRLCLYDMYYE